MDPARMKVAGSFLAPDRDHTLSSAYLNHDRVSGRYREDGKRLCRSPTVGRVCAGDL